MKTRIAVAVAAPLLLALVHPARAQSLVGDLNADGFVGALDLDIVLLDWGNAPPNDPRADPTGDGAAGQDDLDTVQADWGQGVHLPLTPTPGIALDFRELDNSGYLTGYVTQDLVIETTTDWLGAQLIVTLDEPGKIYQDRFGTFDAHPPCDIGWTPPTVEYDTYVGAGFLCERTPLTGAVDLGGDPTWTFDEDDISIGWYTTDTDDIGEFWVARITLADDASGTWQFLATAAPAEGPLLLASGPVVDGYMVPEPMSGMLAACGLAWLIGKKRRR